MGLRGVLAVLNQDANDNHLEVARLLLAGRLPRLDDCWQCYHPKLFHSLCAGVCSVLPTDNPITQTKACQLLNVGFGAATLLVVLVFIRRSAANPVLGAIAFALIALAPTLAGIHAQTTNDALVIFLSTFSIYALWRFLQTDRPAPLAVSLSSGILAAATKGSGLVLVAFLSLYVAGVALVRWREDAIDRRTVAVFLVCLAAFLAYVPYSSYARNAQDRGTPLTLNVDERAPAPVFKRELVADAGVASVAEALGTFRWLGLVRFPYLTNSDYAYPEHRRSLWSQVYGRHFFSRFSSHPQRWRTRMPWPTAIGRTALLLGIVPLGLLALGLVRTAGSVVRASRRRGTRALLLPETPLLLVTCLFLAMLVWLALTYRSYVAMKAIYLYPALLGFTGMFLAGGALLWRPRVPRTARAVVLLALVVLCVTHVADGVTLAYDLVRRPSATTVLALPWTLPDRASGEELLTELAPTVSPRTASAVLDRAANGWPLQTSERAFAVGFGTQAPSTLKFDLKQRYSRLRLGMAVGDLLPDAAPARMVISSRRGKILHRSALLLPGEIEWADVDVASVSTLQLKAERLDRKTSPDVFWVDPVLTRK